MSDAESVNMAADPFDDVVETGEFNESGELIADVEASGDEESSVIDEVSEESTAEFSGEESEVSESKDESEEKSEEVEAKSEEKEEVDSEEVSEEKEELSLESVQKSLEDGTYSFKQEIDGEEVDVTLQDLKNSFTGHKEVDKRFSELDKSKKSWENQVSEVNSYISNFSAKLKDGDAVGAMQYFGEFAGIAPYMIKEQLIAALRPELIRRESLSSHELQNENLVAQNKYLEEKAESDAKKSAEVANQQELQGTINELRETHKIDDAQWDQAFKELDETLPEGKPISAEDVVNQVLGLRRDDTVSELLGTFDSKLSSDKEWISTFSNIMKESPALDADDIKELMQETMDKLGYETAASKLAKKVEKTQKLEKKTVTQKTAVVEEEIDPELEDLFF
jgi:hypothetical protein